jgi:two-component system LytT family sensor kinase
MRLIFPKVLSHVAAWMAFLAIPMFLMPRPNSQMPLRPPGMPDAPSDSEKAISVVVLNLLIICFFYFNYFGLIPKLWTKQKKWQYFTSIVACFVTLQILNSAFTRLILPSIFPGTDLRMLHGMNFFATFFLFGLAWASSSGIRLSVEWKKAEDRRHESENAQLNAELLHLKSQLNPHFLFNTLNGIYTLTLSKNDAAPTALLQLSHLLRYVMAETSTDLVPLEKDIEHLRHFVALHEMRLTAQTPVRFSVQGNLTNEQIAPLLLLPFVENAFKFGSSARDLSPIEITLTVLDGQLRFECLNQIRHAQSDSTGIGIANTRRRLALMYPNRYELDILERAGMFKVRLNIDLGKQPDSVYRPIQTSK